LKVVSRESVRWSVPSAMTFPTLDLAHLKWPVPIHVAHPVQDLSHLKWPVTLLAWLIQSGLSHLTSQNGHVLYIPPVCRVVTERLDLTSPYRSLRPAATVRLPLRDYDKHPLPSSTFSRVAVRLDSPLLQSLAFARFFHSKEYRTGKRCYLQQRSFFSATFFSFSPVDCGLNTRVFAFDLTDILCQTFRGWRLIQSDILFIRHSLSRETDTIFVSGDHPETHCVTHR